MKKSFPLLLLLFTLTTYAQDTTKVEQYCEVVATGRVLSSKITIDINYGEERSLWKDNRLKDEEGKVKKFNSIIDALNYLGKLGWKLVNAFPIYNDNGPKIYHYVFKKEFLKKDTEQ
jgi:hypothetical protein